MDNTIYYESLKIAEWKTDKYQNIYDSKLKESIDNFIKYIEDNNYGKIDIKNKSIDITYNHGKTTSNRE